jgi:hypothetical protein
LRALKNGISMALVKVDYDSFGRVVGISKMTKSDALERNLGGEKLLWSQSPHPTASFHGSTIFTFVFGIFWTCMVFWMVNQQNKNGSHSPAFFGYFMVAFGIFFILSSLSDVFRAYFSIYGITERRLMIVRKYPWSVELESFFSQDIEFVKKVRKHDGRGNIIFKTIKVKSGKGYRDTDIGFFGVDDVDSVESIVMQNFRNNLK